MIKSFAACALTAGLAASQEYLQNMLDREELANEIQERATRDNGHRKKLPVHDEVLDEYQGHYDFEPGLHHDRAHHPVNENKEEEPENNEKDRLIENEDPKICFVKAYARKPLGPPARNVIPENSMPYWNGIGYMNLDY